MTVCTQNSSILHWAVHLLITLLQLTRSALRTFWTMTLLGTSFWYLYACVQNGHMTAKIHDCTWHGCMTDFSDYLSSTCYQKNVQNVKDSRTARFWSGNTRCDDSWTVLCYHPYLVFLLFAVLLSLHLVTFILPVYVMYLVPSCWKVNEHPSPQSWAL